MSANATGDDDTITISATGTILLATQLPSIAADADAGELAITGPGSTQLEIRRSPAAGSFPVITAVAGAKGTLTGIKISNGLSASNGGGVLTAGDLTLNRVEISGNSAPVAGGAGGGAATSSAGALTIRQSTISGNQAGSAGGGGVHASSLGSVTIERSTISGNSTTALSGGGLRVDGPTTVRSSTIANNTGPSGTPATGKNIVLAGAAAALSLQNTIIADAKSTNPMESTVNCQTTAGTITSLGFNMADDPSCTLTQGSDKPDVDPTLGPLQVNRGGTPTHSVPPASPAVDQGSDAPLTGAIDQRGFQRPLDVLGIANASGGDGSDIGAFELQVLAYSSVACGPPNFTPIFESGVSSRCQTLVASVPPRDAIKCAKKKKKKGKARAAAKKCGKKKPKKK